MGHLKYILGAAAGVLVFWLTYSVQPSLWFKPEEAGRYDPLLGALRDRAAPVSGPDDLNSAMRERYGEGGPGIDSAFTAVYTVPGTGEKVYVSVPFADPEYPEANRIQRDAFAAFINVYPDIRADAMRAGLEQYRRNREGMKDFYAEMRKRPQRPGELRLLQALPPEITLEDLERPDTETWVTLMPYGNNLAVLSFRPSVKKKAVIPPVAEVTLANGIMQSEEDRFRNLFGDDSGWDDGGYFDDDDW